MYTQNSCLLMKIKQTREPGSHQDIRLSCVKQLGPGTWLAGSQASPSLCGFVILYSMIMLESGLQIGGLHKVSITAAQPDVVGGIETQCGDICLECGKFYPRLTKLMQIFQMRVIPWANVPPAAYFKGSNRGVCCSDEMCIFI